MWLYNHVAGKDDLLDGLVDIAFGEIDLACDGGDWKTAMRRRATSAREVPARHRWAIGLMASRTRPGTSNLRHHDSVLRCLRESGFSIAMAAHAYSALDSYIPSFSGGAFATSLSRKTFIALATDFRRWARNRSKLSLSQSCSSVGSDWSRSAPGNFCSTFPRYFAG
jgi:tetracycline repressor-like protein